MIDTVSKITERTGFVPDFAFLGIHPKNMKLRKHKFYALEKYVLFFNKSIVRGNVCIFISLKM